MESKPRIIVTMGDPSGIGPEIIIKGLADGRLFEFCRPVVVGDAGVMRKQLAESCLPLVLRTGASASEAGSRENTLDVIDLGLIDPTLHAWGKPDPASGNAAVACIREAVRLVLNDEADAIVTAPLNKEVMNAAGHHYAGHTELLAELTGAKEYGMLFIGGGLRVILATIHAALKDVPRLITHEAILKTLRLAHRAMLDFGIEQPRIGVAALNPHAGEGGLFGTEERDIILPAVLEARGRGIQASDPLPADTLFHQARNNRYDIVVAMYHDQGLAPLKMVAFGKAVNVTVGLPIIRTSVDHGTAYDIAGKGCADPASLREAVKLAVALCAHRARARGTS
jgi:4-phospho-D-threonate 3-dehydrogenase / 4-phospho-D-erythronate 3-dehydrogenase